MAKSVVVASRLTLALRTGRLARCKRLKPKRPAKLLGTVASGGRKRCTDIVKHRLDTFKAYLGRMWGLRKAGTNTKQMARAACTAVTYGTDIQGTSDNLLVRWRSTIARAAAHVGTGKNPLRVLYANDGSAVILDPAFDTHVLPVRHWALAWWGRWIGGTDSQLLVIAWPANSVMQKPIGT